MAYSTDSFFINKNTQWENCGSGISRQFIGYNTQLMVVKVRFEKGAIGTLHAHFHTQGTYVASGKFKITIDGKEEILETGDGFFVQPNKEHGAECLEAGMLIDSFSPIREDFL
ncbi:cupin [Neptunitalea chrysea]|uniref:Cupin n=1 Tax=Neptunitalea chrysea TaxID=1647581 RepID=A0A9W6B964_9FLAO|nr:cupin domain-containing protein [Neptunitalea chrysea]GLB53428.1 cupin [Neptunitalea chrysea]